MQNLKPIMKHSFLSTKPQAFDSENKIYVVGDFNNYQISDEY